MVSSSPLFGTTCVGDLECQPDPKGSELIKRKTGVPFLLRQVRLDEGGKTDLLWDGLVTKSLGFPLHSCLLQLLPRRAHTRVLPGASSPTTLVRVLGRVLRNDLGLS